MAQVLKLVPDGKASAEKVLKEAQVQGLTEAIVLGWDKEGSMYLKTSCADGPSMLWLLEQARDVILMEGREQD